MASVLTVRTVDPSPTVVQADLKLDAAYAAGGYTLTAASCKLREIYGVVSIGDHPGVLVSYTGGKVKLYGSGAASAGAHTELAANSTVVSASTVLRLLVFGRS